MAYTETEDLAACSTAGILQVAILAPPMRHAPVFRGRGLEHPGALDDPIELGEKREKRQDGGRNTLDREFIEAGMTRRAFLPLLSIFELHC